MGALLMVDMAHFAGLVAAGLHRTRSRTPMLTTTTTHKTLGGPRGGVILTNEADLAKKINSAVFPGMQGRPAGARHRCEGGVVQGRGLTRGFAERQARTLAGSRILAEAPHAAGRLADTGVKRSSPAARTSTWSWSTFATRSWTADRPEDLLHEIGITVNRNAVPFDPRPPMVTSGLRIGTPALATRLHGGRTSPRSPT
ncbi:hypothetical protein ACRAWF_35355 [Streptomyces sp. L7]